MAVSTYYVTIRLPLINVARPVTKAKGKMDDRKSPKKNQRASEHPPAVEITTSVQPPAMQSKPRRPAAGASFASSSLSTVTSQEARVFLWDREAESFVSEHEEEVVVARIVERTSGDYNYWLIVTDEDGDFVSHKITSDMNPRWSPKTSSLTWNYFNNGIYDSWALQFTSAEAYDVFKRAFAQCQWETLHGAPFQKAKVGSLNLTASNV
jgi:hypothetical protein